jgi:hypothetical protein
VSRGLATEKLHRGGWPAAGGPAQELKGPANAAPFCSSPHTVLVSRLPAPPLHRHHNYQNFSFSQFPTIIIKISSTNGPYNTRSSARSTPVGDTNPVASAGNQLTSELELDGAGTSSSATATTSGTTTVPLGPTVSSGTAAAAIDPTLQAVLTTLGTDGIRAVLMKALTPDGPQNPPTASTEGNSNAVSTNPVIQDLHIHYPAIESTLVRHPRQ